MFKRIATLALAVTLALTLVIAASASLVSDFAATVAAGNGEAGTIWLQQAGNPDLVFGANSIAVDNRVNNWDSVDLKAGDLADGTYVIDVSLASDDIYLSEVGGGWSYMENPATVQVIDGKFNVGDDGRIRIRNHWEETNDFVITSIKITGEGRDIDLFAGAAAPVGDTSAPVTTTKDGADTGIADVAVASAIALVAAGAVVFSRKRK